RSHYGEESPTAVVCLSSNVERTCAYLCCSLHEAQAEPTHREAQLTGLLAHEEVRHI
ncbi:hypothetical protein HAX54_000124, partial [Datura stramonium]|nr:hypothetical protein [Datura stramonium]